MCPVVSPVSGAAAAQYPGDEYYPYAEREERRELLTTDSTIFYRAVQSPSDLYGLRTGFNLPQVALRRRGLDYTLERTSLMGVAVSYRYLAALRLLGAEEQRYGGLPPRPGNRLRRAACGRSGFRTGSRCSLFLASVRFTGPQLPRGSESRRLGVAGRRLAHFGGSRRPLRPRHARRRGLHQCRDRRTAPCPAFRRRARTFSVLCIVPPSVRGTPLLFGGGFHAHGRPSLQPGVGAGRTAGCATPACGARRFPLALAAYAVPLSAPTSLAATLAAEAGVAKYSMLDWYDARTPMPDNYRYLPSYTGDRETEQAWLARDPRSRRSTGTS